MLAQSASGGAQASVWITRCSHSLCRFILGPALVAASILKAFDAEFGAAGGVGIIGQLLPYTSVVVFEFLFGLWMIFGFLPLITRKLAIGSFALYSCITIYEIAIGQESCGCFGAMSPAPAYTLAFDLLALVALFMYRPASPRLIRGGVAFGRALGFLTIAFWGGLALAVALSRPGSDRLEASLGPEDWIGRCLPLLRYVDVGKDLSVGRWTIVLYRHDCALCQQEIPKYKEIACDPTTRREWGRIALIEVPPYGNSTRKVPAADSPYRLGRLDDSRRWSIRTPMKISTDDCVVLPPRSQKGSGD